MERQDTAKQTEKQAAKDQYRNRKASGLSVEQKLELSSMLRQEQDYNRLQMDEREMLVYGASSKKRKEKRYAGYHGGLGGYRSTKTGMPGMLQAAEEEAEQERAWEKEQKRNRASLMLRSFLAVLLLVVVLLMRYENLSIGGVDYQNLLDSLQSQEFINGIDFGELMPYTDGEQEK